MTIEQNTRALLVADAARAIALLGLDSDRSAALADTVVANMTGSIESVAENSKRYGMLLGRVEALREVMLERGDSEDVLTAGLLDEAERRLAEVQG